MAKKTTLSSFEDAVNEYSVDLEEVQALQNGTWPAWPSGSDIVDVLTGIGGLPKGRIVECYGKPSAGKSTLFMTCAGKIQKMGKIVILLDYERTFDPSWAKTLGMDPSDRNTFLWVQSKDLQTTEQGFNLIYKFLDSDFAKDIGIIIWDSLAGSSPSAIANKQDVEDSVRRAARASILSDELPRLAEKLRSENHDATVAFVNQVRVNMNAASPFAPQETTPGGFAFEHQASLRLSIKHRSYETKSLVDEFTMAKRTERVGQRVTFTVEKTKHGQRGRSAEAIFMYQKGFDNIRTLVELAIKRGNFKKISAQKSAVPPELTFDGAGTEGTEATLVKYFNEHPESYELLREHMIADINRVYWDKVNSVNSINSDNPDTEPIESDNGLSDYDGLAKSGNSKVLDLSAVEE